MLKKQIFNHAILPWLVTLLVVFILFTITDRYFPDFPYGYPWGYVLVWIVFFSCIYIIIRFAVFVIVRVITHSSASALSLVFSIICIIIAAFIAEVVVSVASPRSSLCFQIGDYLSQMQHRAQYQLDVKHASEEAAKRGLTNESSDRIGSGFNGSVLSIAKAPKDELVVMGNFNHFNTHAVPSGTVRLSPSGDFLRTLDQSTNDGLPVEMRGAYVKCIGHGKFDIQTVTTRPNFAKVFTEGNFNESLATVTQEYFDSRLLRIVKRATRSDSSGSENRILCLEIPTYQDPSNARVEWVDCGKTQEPLPLFTNDKFLPFPPMKLSDGSVLFAAYCGADSVESDAASTRREAPYCRSEVHTFTDGNNVVVIPSKKREDNYLVFFSQREPNPNLKLTKFVTAELRSLVQFAYIRSGVFLKNGSILIGSNFTSKGDGRHTGLVLIDPSGYINKSFLGQSLKWNWHEDGDGVVSIVVQNNGSVVIGGHFFFDNGTPHLNFAILGRNVFETEN